MVDNLTPEQQGLADALNMRELAFCNLWLTSESHGMGRAECYIMAGYTAKTKNVAYVQAHRALKRPKIAEYIHAMRVSSMEGVGLTLNYLDRQLKDIIDGSVTEVLATRARTTDAVDEHTGEPLVVYEPVLRGDLDELPDEVQASIQTLKTTQHGLEVKQYSRLDALKLAYQRQGALREGRELSGPGGAPLAAPMFEYRVVGRPGEEPPIDLTVEEE